MIACQAWQAVVMTKKIILNDPDRVGEWVAHHIGRKVGWSAWYAIGVEKCGQLIGGVVMNEFVPGQRCFIHVAATDRRWLSRDLIATVFYCAFIRNRCQVILATIDADNTNSLRLTIGIGFNEVCRVPGGSGHCDLVILAMHRAACRWLPHMERV